MSTIEKTVYSPKNDTTFASPYIDIDEWRETDVKYHYIHGGFKDTDVRFAFFFPEENVYTKRFFHFMSPVPGNENAAMAGDGEKITFAIMNGAYFVESNMGVTSSFGGLTDSTLIYKASAAVAEYSRKVAADLYGEHRPHGYVFGGSGGGYKSMSCIENTSAWDGAVPFVIGSSMSIPYSLMVSSHCARILRHKLPQIVNEMEPGGSKNPHFGLSEEESAAVTELMRFGVNPRSFFSIKPGIDGSLPVLAPTVKEFDPTYFSDFWTVPGYLGADVDGSAARDRLQFKTKISSIDLPKNENIVNFEDRTGVDDAWQRLLRNDGENKVIIKIDNMPNSNIYTDGAEIKVLSGQLSGKTLPIKEMTDTYIEIGGVFGADDMLDELVKLEIGDEIMLDNSDYLAMQTYYRHQIPATGYSNYDQYRDSEGKPLFPQRAFILGPMIAEGGCGSLQSGKIQGKVIVVSALLDGNLPWQADWYRGLVKDYHGEKENENFRLWYVDNAVHSDEQISEDELHIAGYFGVLHQALLDLSDWVERGIAPNDTTNYSLSDGQIEISSNAAELNGIQSVIKLSANNSESIEIALGETVNFEAVAQLPPNAGICTKFEWNFEGEQGFGEPSDFAQTENNSAISKTSHEFNKKGTFFPTVKVSSERSGNPDNKFTQVKNLCRTRVVVK